MSTQLRFHRKILYRLKRRYGVKIDYYTIGESVVDETTGLATSPRTKIVIKKAVQLPDARTREFRSFGIFNSSYDSSSRNFLLDARELPKDFKPHIDHYFVLNGLQYSVKDFVSLPEKSGYWLVCNAVEGLDPDEIFDVSGNTVLDLIGSANVN